MLLSICIPTYNRSKYLIECISSVSKQIQENGLEEDVQICISDNNSNDDTAFRIEEFKKTSSIQLVYHCNEFNIGPDLNYLKCVELSSANFCWLMGSDDAIVMGSLNRVINELRQYDSDAYISNRVMCDINLKPYRNETFFKYSEAELYQTNVRKELLTYFDNSISLAAVFSFLSSIIIKKQKWDSIQYDNSYTGSAYPHVFIILSYLIYQNSSLKIISDPIILCRVGNDSFLSNGIIKRFLIDLDGYLKLANDFFSSDPLVKSSFLGILRYENGFIRLLKMRSIVSKKDWEQINQKLELCGFDKYKLIVLNWLPDKLLYFVGPMIIFKFFLNNLQQKVKRLYY